MAVFFLQHAGKGKAKYDRQGIINHGRYVLRQSARGVVESRHAPSEYGQVLGWLGRVYDESRANARVVDSIIVNLPRELTGAEHARLLRAFLDRVTERRTPYLFVIHTDKPDNPHAHIIIRDADVRTGRRVAGLSKAGSSHRLRALWEALCNSALRDHGVAISRHGQHSDEHRQLNARAQDDMDACQHARTTGNASKRHQMPSSSDGAMGVKDGPKGREPTRAPMADVNQFPDPPKPSATIHYDLSDIQSVLSTDAELNRLLAVKQQLTELKADTKATQAQLDSAVKRMGDLADNVTKLTAAHTSAAQTYADYRRWGVFLRGFKVFGWKSPKRVRAEKARDNYMVTTEVLEHTTNRLESVRKEHRVLQQFAKRVERAETLIRQADMSFGNDADLRDAEVILRNTLSMYADRISEVQVLEGLATKDITTNEANRLRRVLAQKEIRDGYAR